jgi:hypothetical protein
MELKMLRPLYDQLVQSKQQIIRNPNSIRALYKPEEMVKTIDYALANWQDKGKREKALDVLAAQDQKLMSDYMPKTVTAMQGLLGLTDNETMSMLGFGYYVDGLGGVSLGGFWSGIKCRKTRRKIRWNKSYCCCQSCEASYSMDSRKSSGRSQICR